VNWKNDLSDKTREVMQWMGNFSPTYNVEDKEVKGYKLYTDGESGKAYLTSDQLRDISDACLMVAEWLDKRAIEGNLFDFGRE
jgi:hypothetical protein